ncbi:DUF4249 domain-containing protein [Dyadobacter sp. CY326]|uniref:DUF4249 domain-containing protein n=1 Tax=Dyadobacter sp. CY326 TaxID=2907300 RepID=UPI001F47963A|nr:DUF4249 domain-containing protein [Dyadobacter sp. CY326]MCE7067648.1 DUF4249 domain-containing protein [Dyadobacter sp. CY326]
MKNILNTFIINKVAFVPLLFASFFLLAGCEDVIDLETETGPEQLVVDGWITNEAGPQTIKLNWSASYFNNGPAKPVLGAEVTVTDDKGKVYEFKDLAGNGQYIWGKTNADTLGHIGRTYSLKIKNQADIYTAKSELKRVPTVDSIVYRKEKLPFKPDKGPQEGYVAQFYARDFVGEGDTYWIKPLINGKPAIDKAVNISIAYDAAFGSGAPSDGLIFILPIRESLTTDSLYSAGASVGVELHSITNETFEFLKQIREQAGNGGLFAVPITNIKSNVVNADPKGIKALGLFGASAVSRKQTIIDPEKARPDED